MATLNTYVHVHGPDGPVVFGPEDEVPDWAVKLITNEAVWAEGEAPKAKSPRGPGRPPKTDSE